MIGTPGFRFLLFLVCIQLYNKQRTRGNMKRNALVDPENSAWRRLLHHADDDSFLEITGFSKQAFKLLFEALFTNAEIRKLSMTRVGRPNSLTCVDQVGLYIMYVSSRMRLKDLSLIFGVLKYQVSVYVRAIRARIISKLANHPEAAVIFPDDEKKAYFASLVRIREPCCTDVIGFTDGLSIPVQCSEDEIQQNAHYNKYHADTMCNNVFCFSPEGKIIFAAVNYPGSWHDSQVCSQFIRLVRRKLGLYKICVDQGFPRNGDLFDKFVGPISKKRRSITIFIVFIIIFIVTIFIVGIECWYRMATCPQPAAPGGLISSMIFNNTSALYFFAPDFRPPSFPALFAACLAIFYLIKIICSI